MACHLLLKNNTVSLSQPVKRKQSQNRGNMHDNSFLTYDERQTVFSKNLWLLNWLTFYKYYIVFSTAFIASRVSLLSGEEKRKKLGVMRSNEAWKWNNTAKKLVSGYSLCTCSSGSDLASILKVWNRSFRSCQLVWLVWFRSEVWVYNYASR